MAWTDFVTQDPQQSTRILRQVPYLLVLPGSSFVFAPLRRLLAWVDGVPMAQNSRRSIDMKDYHETLGALGLARVGDASPFFAPAWDQYYHYCEELGKAPANYNGQDPRTGRIFCIAPFGF